MFKDDARQDVYRKLSEHDLRVFARFLDFEIFFEAAERVGVRIASSPLNCVTLVWQGIAAAWQKTSSFVASARKAFTLRVLIFPPGGEQLFPRFLEMGAQLALDGASPPSGGR